MIDCPPCPGWYGDNGWYRWPAEMRELCDRLHLPSGFPVHAPCGIRELIDVMWTNGFGLRDMPAAEVDWGTSGLVDRFRRP